ncbi:hypothetical protein LXL04_014943 [Taraxacum kok-saghyz]
MDWSESDVAEGRFVPDGLQNSFSDFNSTLWKLAFARGVHMRISENSDIRIPDIRNVRKPYIDIRIRIRISGYPNFRISGISDSYSDSNI